MDPKKLKTFREMVGGKLDGWEIAKGYFLEPDHGPKGIFPAIDEKERVIIVLKKSDLEEVWKQLKKRSAVVTTLILLVHSKSGVAFSMSALALSQKSLHVFSPEEIKEMCQEEGSMKWTPGGLLDCPDEEVKTPDFT